MYLIELFCLFHCLLNPGIRQNVPQVTFHRPPTTQGYRFRYASEGEKHGALPSSTSTNDFKDYPSIKIRHYSGPVRVYINLINADTSTTLTSHCNRLIGRNVIDGQYTLCVDDYQENGEIILSNVKVQCATTKYIVESVTLEWALFTQFESIQIGSQVDIKSASYFTPDILSYYEQQAIVISKQVKLNALRLAITVLLVDYEGKLIHAPLRLISDTVINDSKSAKPKSSQRLHITRIDKAMGCCIGGDEIFLLCDPIRTEVEIRFFELDSFGDLVWQDFGEFNSSDIHRKCAVVFRTPAYHNLDISSPVRVFVELKRKQAAGQVLSGVAEDSVPVTFTFLPRYDLLQQQQQQQHLQQQQSVTLAPAAPAQLTLPPLTHLAQLPSLDQFPGLLVGGQEGQRKIAVVTTTMMNI